MYPNTPEFTEPGARRRGLSPNHHHNLEMRQKRRDDNGGNSGVLNYLQYPRIHASEGSRWVRRRNDDDLEDVDPG
jgi:hypothetical protein